jgi:lipoprotein NlpD
MFGLSFRCRSVFAIAMMSLVLSGCANKVANRAPVEDRGGMAGQAVTVPMDTPVKQLPGLENAGKPGYYAVKPGDTLLRIGLDHGQSAKDISRWNNLENPNRIEVGQILRIEPPIPTAPIAPVPVPTAPVASAPMSASSGVVTKPVTVATANPVVTPIAPIGVPDKPPTASSSSNGAADDEVNWMWPANGTVLAGFDEVKNKGLDIGGKAGEPVLAAADGRVVYVGAGLRGYGNLIILKHNNTYLTAYAHNQTLLIKEDQSVRRGQKIAEMGSSDADRVKLHFEVRRQGKPVDPAKYLPSR